MLLFMLRIRPAAIADVPLLRTMIRELAEFERELNLCTIEEADLARDGFGENPKFRALIAEQEAQPAATLFSLTIIQAGVGARCSWKTFTYGSASGAKELARLCWLRSLALRSKNTVTECIGKFWTGTKKRSSFTNCWAQSFASSGALSC